MKNLMRLIYVLPVLLSIGCSSLQSFESENLVDVLSCSYLPDNSLKHYTSEECKKYLINLNSYDINSFYESGGFNTILVASDNIQPHFSYLLIDKFIGFGADVNRVNTSKVANNFNSLMLASLYKQPNMIEYLLSKGADVCIKNGKGKTAMDYLIPKNKNIINAEKQANIDKIKPMLLAEMQKNNFYK